MKDVTDFVVKTRGQFYVDREDVDTGDEVVQVGETVNFTHKGNQFTAKVSSLVAGRDDDMLKLELIG